MKMFIHSSFGVLECKEMGLQAIEESIPEATAEESNQVFEDVQAVPVEACSNGLGSLSTEPPDTEN